MGAAAKPFNVHYAATKKLMEVMRAVVNAV